MRTPHQATTPIRIALGLIYFHFGFLKFFPDLSPAELMASQTIMRLGLTLHADTALFALAIFECVIGLLLLFNVALRLALLLFAIHMAGTLTPLFVLPEFTFKFAPFAPTFEGQYILKNLVFLAAGWSLLRDTPSRRRREPPALPAGDPS